MGKEEKTLYHKEFAKFVDSCIISNKTLLTTTEKLFTIENLKDTKNFLKAIKPLFGIDKFYSFQILWRYASLWHTSFFIFALGNSLIKLNSSNYGTLENYSKEQRNH